MALWSLFMRIAYTSLLLPVYPGRDVAEVAGAVEILLCAGFSSTSSGESLTLTRYDVGLLYVISSMLQSAMEAINCAC
jgi:hypothetical protein